MWTDKFIGTNAWYMTFRSAHHGLAGSAIDAKAARLDWLQLTLGTHDGILVLTGVSRQNMVRLCRTVAAVFISKLDALASVQTHVLAARTGLHLVLATQSDEPGRAYAVLEIGVRCLIELAHMRRNVRNDTQLLDSLTTIAVIITLEVADIQIIQMLTMFVVIDWYWRGVVGGRRVVDIVVGVVGNRRLCRLWSGQLFEFTARAVELGRTGTAFNAIAVAFTAIDAEQVTVLVILLGAEGGRFVLTKATSIRIGVRSSSAAVAMILSGTI
jgi:hypothetical protein